MIKKFLLSAFLFVFIFLASGCTIGRAVTGMGQGISDGFQEDMVQLKKADNWAKANLW